MKSGTVKGNIPKKKKDALISIIIPFYNSEQHLDFCLNTVENQTYENIEVIMVNDGSTDSSREIAIEYVQKDSRFFLVDQENRGVSSARNKGIALAKGEYISFVDSDDWVHSKMIEHLYKNAVDYNADISTVEIKRNEQERINQFPIFIKIEVYDQTEYVKKFFKIDSQETVYYCYNKLYHKSVIENNMFPSYKIGEDVVSTYKAIINSKLIVSSSAALYYYRQGSGITSTFNDNYFQLIQVWDSVIEIAKERCPTHVEWAKLNRARINFTILSQMALAGVNKDSKYHAVIKKMKGELREDKEKLIHSRIEFSRKVGILLFCSYYNITARLIKLIIKRKQ